MKKALKKNSKKKRMSADEIADLADQGKNISAHFTNDGQIKHPLQKVNVDFGVGMLKELDQLANELNISRQALIKVYLRQALDQHYLAAKKAG